MHWRKIAIIWVGVLSLERRRRIEVQVCTLTGKRRRNVRWRSVLVSIALRNHISIVLLEKVRILPEMTSIIPQTTITTLPILLQIWLYPFLHDILLILRGMPFLHPPLIRRRRISPPLKRRHSHILLHLLLTKPLLRKPLLDPLYILRSETLIKIEIPMILADFSPTYIHTYLSALKASSVMHLAHIILYTLKSKIKSRQRY